MHFKVNHRSFFFTLTTNTDLRYIVTKPVNYTHPFMPSALIILGKPSLSVVLHPGFVCILTFTDSIGHRAMSAKNSAEALAAKYNDVLHK